MTRNPQLADGQPDERLLSTQVADQLRHAILTGAIEPGCRVRQDELAERFGASRIPVREALRLLESEGLVVLVPNSGAWINKIDRAECIEIYKMRERLEPLALSESVANLSDTDIARLTAMAGEIHAAATVEEYIDRDRKFHLFSYSRAVMPKLLVAVERFWNLTQHYRRLYIATTGGEGRWISDAEHRLMIEAIRRRDSEEAERVIFSHIRRTRVHLQRMG